MARIRAAQLDAATLARLGLPAPKAKRSRRPGPGADLPPLHPGEIVVALDVSSSATGFCRGTIGPSLEALVVDCGVYRPKATLRSWERIEATTKAVASLLAGSAPERTRVVMEWSEGRQGRHKARGDAGATLAVMGQAQGATWLQAKREGFRVELVGEEIWTRWKGKGTPKADRIAWVRRNVPAYLRWLEDHADRGGDCADAVAIFYWRVARAKGEPGIDWKEAIR